MNTEHEPESGYASRIKRALTVQNVITVLVVAAIVVIAVWAWGEFTT